ncbi:MAG: isoaspartyl peptidase/L-asparaginase [Betaproteobacteria bacterium]|nr:isoaspartyl peptidase/L-asparaginase [Betaproteobacteria bacterium]
MSAAVESVRNGRSALDAIEAGIRVVELDPAVRSAGLGGAPNVLGVMECDASIMCGATLRTGAVGALQDYFHAISVARQVMESTPHVMLVGEGAARFAAEIGERKGNLLSDEAKADYEKWIRAHVPPDLANAWPNVPLSPVVWPSAEPETAKGTTCFLVRTQDENWGGGVSTSGWGYKYPGRLGDSPIIGAGMYVDNRYGAAACTHTGEMTIRAGTARAVIAYLKRGASAEEACREALDDLRYLKGGYLGPVIVHVMDREGTPFVASIGLKDSRFYWYWGEGMEKAECRKVLLL